MRVPHTLALLFAMMVLALVMTWTLPQGEFATALNDQGRAMVVPGTFTLAEERVWLPPWAIFTAVPRALADAQVIIFFLFIVGGTIAVLQATGAMDALLGAILRRIGHSPALLIGIGLALFALGSGTLGVSTEYIPFAAMLVALCVAMRLDAMTAMGIMIGGYCIGYGVAALNPYTVLVAQGIAELPPASGIGYRLALFLPFVAIGVHHTWRYAQRVRRAPADSLVADIPEAQPAPPPAYPPVEPRHWAILGLTALALGGMVYGILARGWYLVEVGGVWLGLALAAGVLGRLGADGTARNFAAGAASLAVVALLVGFARGIGVILEDGRVLHTIVHGISLPLQQLGPELSAVGMMLVQAVINLFVPSGSGQAFVTMPIMAPVGDLVGVSRQVAVLAFQFGDGFANLVVPTNVVLMAILGVVGVPYDRWMRFAWPLFLKLMAAGALALVVAVRIGYA
ncbi:AbgT family transporter [Thioalkalivibrio sp. XN8]|uniref:YfcC family protein n=1 Tax=Thioalkalivibrio sp. XN8 TaxID=2712863 RepID=UPI0013ED74FD|nr:AbgT family transporter [Thioalkalivibrio sp. XN8]NGP54787.1 YfcC family protein [Thioalkalivibrio sp. XN8]